jgi:hypothetical protein
MFPEVVADRIARKLDLDVDDIGICHACLSFVSFAIAEGNVREIRRWTNKMTPDLWAEGLEQPARMALRRAEEYEALVDLDRNGARSNVAKAIVRKLAADLHERAQGDLLRMGFRPWPPV